MSKLTNSIISEQLKMIPGLPGVYLMKDASGNIIYVGKAANLLKRVSSYFISESRLMPRIRQMIDRIRDIEFIVTSSEQDALILELNLIKRYRPRYNVSLKDDKTFPYLKIDTAGDWPRIYVTRRVEQNGGRYFGPFASAGSVKQTIKILKEIFPFRSCTKNITGNASRPCLQHFLLRCPGPCIGAVSKEEYERTIKQIVLFLEGKQDRVIRDIKCRMQEAARSLDFERAALLRDRIAAVSQVIEGQRLATRVRGEQDVIAFALDKDRAYAQIFFIRNGRLIGRENFIVENAGSVEPCRIMSSFVEQFYHSAIDIPPRLLLQYPVEDKAVIEGWLRAKRGAVVRINVPRRGSKKDLVDIVAENARQGLDHLKVKQMADPEVIKNALSEVKEVLELPCLPSRIEGYDISNIQGKMAVGSMVIFENGRPNTSSYRRFRIRTVPSSDDYAMLSEVILRRFKRLEKAKKDWVTMPDLILVDGGRGQLNAVVSAIEILGIEPLPVIGLAKEDERIFIHGRKETVLLSRSSPGLQLLERVRDEAHRFALGYHQKIRQSVGTASLLDEIPGIGPVRKRALLKKFGSVSGIRKATLEEMATVPSMYSKLAEKVKEYL